MKNEINIFDSLTVFHVGGKGGYGSLKYVFKRGRDKIKNMNLLIFEADITDKKYLEDDKGKYIKDIKNKKNINVSIYPYCLSDHIGKEKFYINKDSWSSSLFLISEKAKKWSCPDIGNPKWIDHCSPVDEKIIDITTFDKLSDKIKCNPDVLSIDAQGSEYSILKGASNYLSGDLLAVITEVEFQELYEKQPLFSDQSELLEKYNFIFIDLLSIQKFYPGPIIGKGFLTVGEALFLRDFDYFAKKYENDLDKMFECLLKLIWIAIGFEYMSYAYIIIDYISTTYNKEWNKYILDKNLSKWLKEIFMSKKERKNLKNKKV